MRSNKATGIIIGTGIEINGWQPSAGSCFIFPYNYYQRPPNDDWLPS